jgi:hypothetical protein
MVGKGAVYLTDSRMEESDKGQVAAKWKTDLTYRQHLMAFYSAIVKVMNRVTNSLLQHLLRGNYISW